MNLLPLITALKSFIASFLVALSLAIPGVSIHSDNTAAVASATLVNTKTEQKTGQATSSVATSTITKAVSLATQKAPPQKKSVGTPAKKITTATSSLPRTTGQTSTSSDPFTLVRPPLPYTTPPTPFADVNTKTRDALVNIFCKSQNNPLNEISGSGVIIDPRGVVLTNAHVAQYLLLDQAGIDISCVLRTGSPAVARWNAEVLYLPSAWIDAHASEISSSNAMGTGEDDYALLLITGATPNTPPMPSAFPYVAPDTREAVAFVGDSVVVATYPAGFIGAITAQTNLSPVSTITPIQQLMTFKTGSVDILSLGGIVVAQAGSSGGAVVNAWERLVGLVVTSSTGESTANRDLHAVTLAHIERSMTAYTGAGLSTFLSGDLSIKLQIFQAGEGKASAAKLRGALGF